MSDTPQLQTAHLLLEPVCAAHAEEAWPHVDDERMWRFFPEKRPQTPGDLHRLYRKWENGSPSPEEIWHNWMCRERSSGELAGGMQSTVLPGGRIAYIAYAIYPPFQQRGYAREASAAVIEYVRKTYTLERVYAEMDVHNEASYRLAESLGFLREREHDGEYRYELKIQ